MAAGDHSLTIGTLAALTLEIVAPVATSDKTAVVVKTYFFHNFCIPFLFIYFL
ncbi:hypothetical protein SMSK597_1017 [Streptococcus mitis SK597]|uniref:Uncharacterized protein n=1 Tax=Streptococcus mitis SK597 TaxID=585204 RepID=E1LSQ8_STRMT|nr:hypothetical protein SMSK597_1017 [Streptococcus mitis SK597]